LLCAVAGKERECQNRLVHASPLLLLVLAMLPQDTDRLVLRSGDFLPVSGPVQVIEGRAIFRAPSGSSFSVDVAEIDVEATIEARQRIARPVAAPRRLAVSAEEKQRLLREIEKNHAGKPAPPEQFSSGVDHEVSVTRSPAERSEDEWYWRDRARGHQETLRRAQEDLELLIARRKKLESEILGLRSLGYEARQFSYQIVQLQVTRDLIPNAELEVQRAERAWFQFQDDARRRNILPGWLR
jgi:hypothetical protein